jgi:predicted lipid-binding transport protein (Tim44 family)
MRYPAGLLAAAMLGVFAQPTSAQDFAQRGRPGAAAANSPIARQAPADPNAWTVGLAGGLLEGTFIRYAADLAKVLDDGDILRVIPMVTFGARAMSPTC